MTPLSYDVSAAAERIGPAVTVDWLKKKAAANAIPHTKSGNGRGRSGRIAFTEAHLVEILQMLERRPESMPAPDQPSDFASIVSRGKRPA